VHTYGLLTIAPNAEMAELHDRMLVILNVSGKASASPSQIGQSCVGTQHGFPQ